MNMENAYKIKEILERIEASKILENRLNGHLDDFCRSDEAEILREPIANVFINFRKEKEKEIKEIN